MKQRKIITTIEEKQETGFFKKKEEWNEIRHWENIRGPGPFELSLSIFIDDREFKFRVREEILKGK